MLRITEKTNPQGIRFHVLEDDGETIADKINNLPAEDKQKIQQALGVTKV